MFLIYILIGAGGFLGSICRYLVQQYAIKAFNPGFPYGTLMVNIFGSLLIGILYAMAEKGKWITPGWRFFLSTGFCGGFTTFSAFAIENVLLLKEGNYTEAFIYIGLSLFIALAATFAGLMAGRAL
jgi:CrcB protein